MTLYDGDVMRHAGVAEFFKPFAWILLHLGQTVGSHQMALRLEGLSFPSG